MRLLFCVVILFLCACSTAPKHPLGLQSNGWVRSGYDSAALMLEGTGGGVSYAEYMIQAGDTLSSIATRLGVSVKDLLAHNKGMDPKALRVGQVIKTVARGAGQVAIKAVNMVKETTSHHNNTVVAPTTPVAKESGFPFVWPVQGQVVERYGSERDGKPHDGIDIAAPRGTQVRAAADGHVLFSSKHGDYGNLIVIRHENGLVTVYAHSDVNLVQKGQRVKTGAVIARVGDTGIAKETKLHFEVREGVKTVNPMGYLPP